MQGNFWRISFQIMLTALGLIIGDYLMDGVSFDARWIALIAALVIALLNAFVKPLLVILTIPATILTFGLFLWVINAVVLLLAREIVPGFHIETFWTALWLALIVSLINALFGGNVRVMVNRNSNQDEM